MSESTSTPNLLHFTVEASEAGERVDRILTNHLSTETETISRVKVQDLIKEGHVSIGGKVAKPSSRLDEGEEVHVRMIEEILTPDNSFSNAPENIALTVLYEDENVAAINKPAGLVVHPAAGHEDGTLVNALLARYPQVAFVGGEGRAGIVHRLDKDTSGVMLVALNESARLNLMTQFEKRRVQKRYLALIEGEPKTPTGEINAPLARDPDKRKKMAIVRGGREAISEYNVIHAYVDHSLVEVFPKTGRTHQIRVHLSFIGHPIVGDPVYGRRKQTIKLDRHFLHAESISFHLPVTGKPITIHAPLPADLQQLLDRLEAEQLKKIHADARLKQD